VCLVLFSRSSPCFAITTIISSFSTTLHDDTPTSPRCLPRASFHSILRLQAPSNHQIPNPRPLPRHEPIPDQRPSLRQKPRLDQGKLSPDVYAPVQILPISKKEPNRKIQYNDYAIITPNDRCAMFNFGLDSAKTAERHCTLVFSFAAVGQLKRTSLYKYEGPLSGGHFEFAGYNFNLWDEEGVTTWND
jgi:hypothetical protein